MRWLALVALLFTGCVHVHYTTAGPCPAWSERAIAQWEELEMDPKVGSDVIQAVGEWIEYCEAVEPRVTYGKD